MKNKSRKEAIKRWMKEKEAWKKETDFREYFVKISLKKKEHKNFHKVFPDHIND